MISLFSLVACNKKHEADKMHEPKLFELLDASETGVNFMNEIEETKELNVMQYEYMYNGLALEISMATDFKIFISLLILRITNYISIKAIFIFRTLHRYHIPQASTAGKQEWLSQM